jgi:glycosyltransferase involved in cell wall biosynthesis
MNKIVHITTVHPRRDTRIFYRECVSLANNGFDVILIVADGLGNEVFKDVEIIDLGNTKNRVKNFIKSFFQILKIIKTLRPNLVHFHDAELMIVGWFINNRGIPVVYDIHENVAMQILDKKHFHPVSRYTFHQMYKLVEKLLINKFYLIFAEDSYAPIYKSKGKLYSIVLNLPETHYFREFIKEDRTNENGIFYIGGISNHRGLDTTLEALKILKERNIEFFMHYIGPIPSKELIDRIGLETIENNIKFYGRLDLMDGYALSRKCKVGLAVLKPIENYKYSYPTKIFEYMSIKLPIVTSNFKLYKDVVEANNCGYCIDPFSSEDLANSIETIFKDKNLSIKMGENGFNLVNSKFNWEHQEKTLISYYKKVLKRHNSIYDK